MEIIFLEKITRFNQPYKAKNSKSIEKSASTSKLTHGRSILNGRNPYQMKNYEYKEKNEVKSMPEIQKHNKEIFFNSAFCDLGRKILEFNS